jgi:transcriptional regulator with XRE-family HTH domain
MRGSELRRIRGRLKMSQAEMARALGLKHKSQVSYMESGRFGINGPAEEAIRRLAAEGKPLAAPPEFTPADVRRIRLAMGMTQKQLAEILGLKRPTQVGHLESGRTRVNWSKAILLQMLAEKIRPKKTRKS